MRKYHGETSWDIGFLMIDPGRVCYFGDQTGFELRPGEILTIEVKRAPILLGGFQRLTIEWSGLFRDGQSLGGAFSMELRDCRTASELRERTEAVKEQIERWNSQPSGSAEEPRDFGYPPM